jgi:hypothetical protein
MLSWVPLFLYHLACDIVKYIDLRMNFFFFFTDAALSEALELRNAQVNQSIPELLVLSRNIRDN